MKERVRIAVVGSINRDMVISAERIPAKGETVYGKTITYNPGGKGANQAVAMARLGANVDMFGCVGNDANGKKMIENLQKNHVGTEYIDVVEGISTGLALITVGEMDNTIVIVPGANQKLNKSYIDTIENVLKSYDMVVVQHEIPLDTVHYIVCFCEKNNIPVILNPAPAAKVPEEIIEKVTFITPNEHEAKVIFGRDVSMAEMLKKYPEKLIITQGEKGVSVCLKNGKVCTIPARKSTVVDTTGAGDTLNGAFAYSVASGDTIIEALAYANIAAGLSVEKAGAQNGMPYAKDVFSIH